MPRDKVRVVIRPLDRPLDLHALPFLQRIYKQENPVRPPSEARLKAMGADDDLLGDAIGVAVMSFANIAIKQEYLLNFNLVCLNCQHIMLIRQSKPPDNRLRA